MNDAPDVWRDHFWIAPDSKDDLTTAASAPRSASGVRKHSLFAIGIHNPSMAGFPQGDSRIMI
jgi:hypothetical protein